MSKTKSAGIEPSEGEDTVTLVPARDRRQHILREAARLFVQKGFDGASMRDIANATGILVGSLYHHFASKEEMFMAVHAMGMQILIDSVKAAVADVADPWDRLSEAAAAHCSALLEAGDFMTMVVPNFHTTLDKLRGELVRQRDTYEGVIAELVAALDLPDDVDRTLFRLHLLGALNWTQAWYRPGRGLTPAEIGREMVRTLRGAR